MVPRLGVEEIYSDNIRLAPASEETGDFVTDVSPGISIRGSGRRLTLNFDYNLQTLVYARDSGSDDIYHQLQAEANTELIRQSVFLDMRSTVSQQNTDNVGIVSDDNISVTDNRSDVITYSISPIFVHRFGSYADSEVRYTFDNVSNDNGGETTNSSANRVNARISSGTQFNRLPWAFTFSGERIDNDDGSVSTFRRIDGLGRYRLNRKIGLRFSAGFDSNDFATTQGDESGVSWDVGITWTPSDRTSLEAGYGRRFFGSNYFLNLSHRSRRTIWQASFDEDVTTTRQIQLERQVFVLVDEFGAPIPEPETGDPILVPLDLPTSTDEVLVSKNFEGSVAVKGRRTDFSIGLYYRQREFQLTGDDETVFGGDASVERRLSSKTTAGIAGNWQHSEFRTGAGERLRWDVGLTLRRRFAHDINGFLNFRHVRQGADSVDDGYEENRFSVLLSASF